MTGSDRSMNDDFQPVPRVTLLARINELEAALVAERAHVADLSAVLDGIHDVYADDLVAERALSDALAAACAEYMTVELAIAKHEGCKAQRPCPECDDLGEALQDAEGNARDALTAWRSARAGLTTKEND